VGWCSMTYARTAQPRLQSDDWAEGQRAEEGRREGTRVRSLALAGQQGERGGARDSSLPRQSAAWMHLASSEHACTSGAHRDTTQRSKLSACAVAGSRQVRQDRS
jgi:hypothetical protein